MSPRKHGPYIAVNCGAIPEGTIDSELFGHEKGSFTGAHEARTGYFEVSNGGTIFLDEVGELPLNTQVRLLRVLETGEFIKVGSSKTQKTNVRVVAATNVELLRAIESGKFREDLYYRLNTVPIRIPPLRDRKEDINLIFRKFAHDFAERYRIPALSLQTEAMELLTEYRWPGNIRQLKNITEQMSILEKSREVSSDTLLNYLPPAPLNNLPILLREELNNSKEFNEREVLYKLIFEMKKEMNDLRGKVNQLMQHNSSDHDWQEETTVHELNNGDSSSAKQKHETHFTIQPSGSQPSITVSPIQKNVVVDESLSLTDKEKEFIQKALQKHKGRRKLAAKELGISERTLYRKMNEYGIH